MQPMSVWRFISLGIDIGILRVAEVLPKVRELEDEEPYTFRVPEVEDLIKEFEELDFLGARGIARSLNHESYPGLTGQYLDALRYVLESESERIQFFSPAQTRWDKQKLLGNVSELFAPRVYGTLHEVAQYDFSEAGKCIVFERSTAAAFHMMRGTEMSLRQLYTALTGKHITNETWFAIVEDLQSLEGASLSKALYDRLNYIRVNFRNPTQHPDKIYDTESAQDLFGVCIDVINQIVPIIWQRQDQGPDPE